MVLSACFDHNAADQQGKLQPELADATNGQDRWIARINLLEDLSDLVLRFFQFLTYQVLSLEEIFSKDVLFQSCFSH